MLYIIELLRFLMYTPGWEGGDSLAVVVLEGVLRQLQALLRPVGPQVPDNDKLHYLTFKPEKQQKSGMLVCLQFFIKLPFLCLSIPSAPM